MKRGQTSPQGSTKPRAEIARRNNRRCKLDEPRIKAVLHGWMFKDNLSYQVIRARLLERFGMKVGMTTLCEFYQRHSRPGDAPASVTVIRIELAIRSDRPVEVRLMGPTGGGKGR